MPEKQRHIVRKPTSRVPRMVYVRPVDWEWAQEQHIGGASGFIASTLSQMRKRDVNRKLKTNLQNALREISRLQGLLLAAGKDVSE